MEPQSPTPLRGLVDDTLRRQLAAAQIATMYPVPTAGPVAPAAPQPARADPMIDYLAAVVWAARDLVRAWHQAGVLGVASRDGASVPALLAAVEQLRRALEGDIT